MLLYFTFRESFIHFRNVYLDYAMHLDTTKNPKNARTKLFFTRWDNCFTVYCKSLVGMKSRKRNKQKTQQMMPKLEVLTNYPSSVRTTQLNILSIYQMKNSCHIYQKHQEAVCCVCHQWLIHQLQIVVICFVGTALWIGFENTQSVLSVVNNVWNNIYCP